MATLTALGGRWSSPSFHSSPLDAGAHFGADDDDDEEASLDEEEDVATPKSPASKLAGRSDVEDAAVGETGSETSGVGVSKVVSSKRRSARSLLPVMVSRCSSACSPRDRNECESVMQTEAASSIAWLLLTR